MQDQCMSIWYPKIAIDKHSVIVKCVLLATKIVKSQKYLYDHPQYSTWWEKYNMQILWTLFVATV